MNELIFIAGAVAVAAGYAVGSWMLRKSAIEEMGILIENGSTAELLESRWGEDEFPDFFAAAWGSGGRDFYRSLSKALRGARYGESRRLLARLIRVEDDREKAKGAPGSSDEGFRARSLSTLGSFRGKGGFESVLSAFIEKGYTERKHGDRG